MADRTDRKRIKYFVGPQRDDQRPKAADDSNNPASMNFLPLEERTERGRARWWALHGTKKRRDQAEFDR